MPLDPNAPSKSGGEGHEPNSPALAASEPGEESGPPAEESRGKPHLISPMPRRKQIGSQETRASTLSLPPPQNDKAPVHLVLWRVVWWGGKLGWFFAKIGVARFFRRSNPRVHSRNLRETLEGMGPTAIKVGQQLSMRADLLPVEYCEELGKMLDRVPPFPFSEAKVLIQKAVKLPLEEVFEQIDPEPIGSASLSCVYQAKLLTGHKVALKVKRPGIGLKLNLDLRAISLLCLTAETLGIIRPGLTRNMRLELARMLTEELNFRLEARYTEIFRRVSKEHNHVSAPKVFAHLCDNDVLVTEFVSGVFLNEILNAIERGNPAELEQLLQRGFCPETISRRMMQVFHWECFESLFFHADPHPANIIVRPDNTIIMIDFGSCGSVSSRTKRRLMEFNRHMGAEDLHGMVQSTIAMLEPLPPFDVDSFAIDLMNIFREVFFAMKSKYSPWYDKCSGGTWMRVIALGQKYRIPMTLDTVRMFRASFMYDSIIYRLDPRLDPVEEFRVWAESWDKKHRRRIENALLDRIFGPLDSDFSMSSEVASLLRNALDRFGNLLDQPSYNFGFTISKVAYVVTVLIKAVGLISSLALMVSLVRMLLTYSSNARATPADEFMRALGWTLNNRVVLVGFTIYVVITVRKILFRLEDVDVK